MGALDGMRIEPARPPDLDDLSRAFASLHDYYRSRFRQPGGILLVARVGRPVGTVFLSTHAPWEPELVRRLGCIPMLHKLIVSAHLRNRRIGTRLILAAENTRPVRRVRRLAVGVDIDNEGAARLYRRLGYREWAYGLLDTVREHRDPSGGMVTVPDRCRVYLKRF